MTNWTAEYLTHVLDAKEWSMNRLAEEIGVAASTINRPLRLKEPLSAKTVAAIYQATGIDPADFVPKDFQEPISVYRNAPSQPRPRTVADEALSKLDTEPAAPNAQSVNEIKVAVVGPIAQIVATVDRDGIAKLRAKLDAIESMLD
jgi:transcriptional regulator with XRE-family HTH domain